MKGYGFVLLCLGCTAAAAGEETISLRDGQGQQAVVANCSGCHSLDYILTNSPFLDRAGWDTVLNKMIEAMGAPVTAADRAAILDYLTRQYGR